VCQVYINIHIVDKRAKFEQAPISNPYDNKENGVYEKKPRDTNNNDLN